MKCSTGVVLYKGVTSFQKSVDGEELYAKKYQISVFQSESPHRHELLGQSR